MDGLVLNLDAGITQSYPGSGTAWTDVNGLGPKNNGTLINGPTFNSANGGSIVFDGTNDTAVTDNNMSLTQNFAMGIWFNPTSLPVSTANNIVFVNAESGQTVRLYKNSNFDANSLAWLIYYETTTATISAVLPRFVYNSETWYNSVMSISDTGTYRLYVNGILRNQTSPADFSRWLLPNNKIILANGGAYTGKISSFNVWQKNLNADEILQNYNAQKSRFNL
jgi:hypothetical protein